MTFRDPDRRRLASLLKERSVKVGEFRLASGQTSSVYVDVKKTSLTGEGAQLIGLGLWDLCQQVAPQVVAAGGLTLGADPLLTAMAIAAHQDGNQLDSIIVRKATKEHGTRQALEMPGELLPGQRVVAIDDVITTAGSTLEAIARLREAGFVVEDALCVVDRQSGGEQALAEAGVRLHSLFLLQDLL
ncbi:MAG: orotate phosphoribosyltransferase [Bradymonadaceae bacterium]|nr:orotate phosphoribosyltransferase [Lujinxingiaceae bacterium]